MRRYGTALAVALAAILAAAACNDYGNTFQVPTGARISSLSPDNVTAGSPDFTLSVIGGGFVAKTVVQWNGQTIPTQILTDSAGNITGITATVAASLVAKAGTAFVNTLSPHSGAGTNGLSNPIAFVINAPANPLPSVSSISPSCAVAGGASFTLTVTGSNFLPTSDPSGGSQVKWTTSATQSTLAVVGTVSATQIQATVGAGLIASTGTANVSVFNPPAPQSGSGNGGGGTSQTNPPFTIMATSCPAGSARAASAASQSAAEETPAVSADGRYVTYTAAQGEHTQIYLRDTCLGAAAALCAPSTQLVSTDAEGKLTGTEAILPSISASGRLVAFVAVTPSHAKAADAKTQGSATANSGLRQVFVRDTCLGAANCTPKTTRISLQPGDAPALDGKPAGPALSGGGGHVAIADARNLTVFGRATPVDDHVFLTLTNQQ